MDQEEKEEQVSFQELKKRWAQQEAGVQPCRQDTSNQRTSSGNPESSTISPIMTPASSVRSTASTNNPIPAQIINKSELSPPFPSLRSSSTSPSLSLDQQNNDLKPTTKPPIIPPKPNTTSATISSSLQPQETSTPLAKRISLLAQQFDKSTSISNMTTSTLSKPAVNSSVPSPIINKKYHSAARQEPSVSEQTNHPDLKDTPVFTVPIPISSQQQLQQEQQQQQQRPSGITSVASSPGATSSAPPPILPPRPAMVNVTSFESLPQLPPRPSTSTLARSHTINHSFDHHPPLSNSTYDVSPLSQAYSAPQDLQQSLKRSQTLGPMKRDVTTTTNLLTKSVYPDFSKATRNPPTMDEDNGERRFVGGQHRGTHQPMAASGCKIATGTQQAKVWDANTCRTTYGVDLVGPNDNERIRSYTFVPPLKPADEGRYLWAGMHDGTLVAMDTTTNEVIGKTSSCHKHPISFMLRRRNVEIWTLDESGLLAIWPVLIHFQQNQQPYHPFEIQPIKHLVTPKAVTALTVGTDLWISSGRTIHVYKHLGGGKKAVTQVDDKQVRIPNDLGNITQFVTMPFHPGQVFASHDDGKVSVWDIKTTEKIQVNAVSLYGICAMVAVGDYHLWTGYNTGMVYVYDTRPEKWLVVKTWRAHHGSIVSLLVDDSSFIRNGKSLQVITGDSHGHVAIWDGLMVQNWQGQQLLQQAQNYCSYSPIKVMICSWNIDANKPEKLVGRDNELVHEWLGSTDDPDIIVVGIQEIVDLESKKQTAKSLFASRKKTETLQEAEEMLTHRYRLWHDHLIRVIGNNYGHDTYTVIKTDQLVGLFSCIFVKNSEAHRVRHCDSTVVKTGLKVMNKSIHGNKGGIAIRFLFDHSSLCFVNCHLAAGQSHTQDRNANAESILHSANFPDYEKYLDVFANGGDGSLILDHEHCFLSGDLNYRIAMERKEVLELLKRKDKVAAWETLQIHDQLKRQHITNPLFKLLWFQEPPLLFDPTYKYDRGTDNYDSSEKKRVPAWCDRILCRSNMAHNIYYRRHEVKASDHRPISAAYNIQVKEIDGHKRDRLLEKIEKDWFYTVEKLIMEKKKRYIVDYELCSLDQATQFLQESHWNIDQVVQHLLK
ncbi:Endonuclease/exonuclease/phosphatase [Halteromyces radiatus]|uniref:Endonuclease/exonuclease/phosphatase n=1 Tax=Halteromyces radiatus TaxID=101107 RepID=UPI00221F1277|nr:Endonuclease/exonuclease/phosphatase [Halteromyces radiatus]KAI8099143.1 Endonuclease/exonuclease/phosphatase [Halteromyces radiatus]